MNIGEILSFKFPNVDFTKSVIVQDDGQGPYIKKWDNSLGPQPTSADLDQWAKEIEPVKFVLVARQNRRNEYPPIGDQLDMLYKAMDSGVLPVVPDFYNSIKAVKTKYPLVGN